MGFEPMEDDIITLGSLANCYLKPLSHFSSSFIYTNSGNPPLKGFLAVGIIKDNSLKIAEEILLNLPSPITYPTTDLINSASSKES